MVAKSNMSSIPVASSRNSNAIRPTKKQKELLGFIEQFIAQHGYSPSYREIMNGLQYSSLATVALHVGSLIKRGHLVKRSRSARSLEVVGSRPAVEKVDHGRQVQVTDAMGEAWIESRLETLFVAAEQDDHSQNANLEKLACVLAALDVLNLTKPKEAYSERFLALQKKARD